MDGPLRTQSNYSDSLTSRGADWSAIWGGVFVFAAIWTVFEVLACAIFAGSSGLGNPRTGMGAGMAIWTIVLTIIAMYIAGRETSRLAGAITRHNGLMHGMMMFGLSAVSAIVLTLLAGTCYLVGSAATSAHHISVGVEWTTFITLFVGWFAAMGGASTGTKRGVVESRPPTQMRPAA
jgi:hypothetical protein